MGSILKVENLTYKNILKNINFVLEKNTFNIMLGSNASGKTTIVKAVCNLIDYEGNIFAFNQLISKNNIDETIKKIGVLTDFSTLLDGTVLYNITYPLLNLKYNIEKAKKMTFAISKKLGIDNLLTKNISDLTTSDRKLVLFARATVSNPELVIIDSTLEELDQFYRDKLIKYLKKMKSTILYITNDEDDLRFCDNLILIDKGVIIASGTIDKIIKEEKLFHNVNAKLPFNIDLLNKLKFYNLIKDTTNTDEGIIDKLWK